MWRELMEANTNASTGNPFPIPVVRLIRRMRELVLEGRIVIYNILFLSGVRLKLLLDREEHGMNF